MPRNARVGSECGQNDADIVVLHESLSEVVSLDAGDYLPQFGPRRVCGVHRLTQQDRQRVISVFDRNGE